MMQLFICFKIQLFPQKKEKKPNPTNQQQQKKSSKNYYIRLWSVAELPLTKECTSIQYNFNFIN